MYPKEFIALETGVDAAKDSLTLDDIMENDKNLFWHYDSKMLKNQICYRELTQKLNLQMAQLGITETGKYQFLTTDSTEAKSGSLKQILDKILKPLNFIPMNI